MNCVHSESGPHRLVTYQAFIETLTYSCTYAHRYKHGISTIDLTGSIQNKYIRRTRGGYKTTLSVYNCLVIVNISNLMSEQAYWVSSKACLVQWPASNSIGQQRVRKDKHTVILNIPATRMEGYLTQEPQPPQPQGASLCLIVLNGFLQELLVLTICCNKWYHCLGMLT